ncbi:trypsin-like peptidase domain-containing protein [Candidatus Nomurabacteria bacterium]|nr:MAG: trypsin-like peptidase domain-containing protein [Candidatus Nomurabacteria bacterium]
MSTNLREFKIKPLQKKYIEMGLVALVTTLVVMVIAGSLLWGNRTKIISLLAGSYMAQTSENPLAGSSPVPFTEESFVVNAVKRANPAVVSISITKDVPTYETYYSPSPTNPFGDMFGGNDFFNQFFQQQVPQQKQNGTEKQEVGGGSGFIITDDGLIVTNRHVVADEDADYTVYTNDGKKYTAKVLARDQILDIAVIKIDAPIGGLPYLELGDSDSLELGQSVVAIGNALAEFKNSVSVGVVSGLSRSIVAGDAFAGTSEQLDRVIQTDAAINPGNSGGPLLNLRGQVIGINVAVVQGSSNIGFALPINSVKSVISSVKETGKIIRPYLGIRYTEITPELKDANKLAVDYGVLIQRGEDKNDLAVIPGSPADKVGIVENDIILELDGVKLDEDHSLALMIRDKKVGDTVTLKVLSKGVEKTVQVKLEAAPE